jgi:hypothetical protein
VAKSSGWHALFSAANSVMNVLRSVVLQSDLRAMLKQLSICSINCSTVASVRPCCCVHWSQQHLLQRMPCCTLLSGCKG